MTSHYKDSRSPSSPRTRALPCRWRRKLTSHLHRSYCGGSSFARLPPRLDNPDQRIAHDAGELCDVLGAITKVAVAAPFKICYYAVLAHAYLHWAGLAAVTAFFLAGAAMQR
jgi:ABC-type uncharacterized transport system fused permease/ATPase subunit